MKLGDYYNMKINVNSCARCGEDHKDIEFLKLTNPIIIPIEKLKETNLIILNYWGMCPKLNEPIIMMIMED